MAERSIELITGPYRSGKSIWVLDQVAEHCRRNLLSGKQAIITVPSHRYKRLVEERLVELVAQSSSLAPAAARGLLGLKILPFYDLCHSVLRQAGCGFRLIPDSIRPAILVKAIEKVKAAGRLTGLGSIADFAGTHAHMLELIDELERAGFSPSEVISQLSKMAASDARYMELGRVYEAYWLELESLDVYDERKLAYKTREILNKLDPDVLNIGMLAVDGFDRFNRLQLQVLSSISRQSERTLIAFDYVDDVSDYSWKDKSLKELREAFAPQLKESVRTASGATSSGFAEIKFRALDRLMEMEEIAREAKKCLIAGYTADQIVVVARSIKPYMIAIRAAFERAQIDYFLDEPIELGSLPLVKYLRRLLHLPVSDFARQDVVRTLSSPFFNKDYLDLNVAEIEEIDDQSLSSLTVKGAGDWYWALKLSKLIERLSLPHSLHANYEKTLTEHVSFVEDLIEDLLVLPNDEEFSDPVVSWEEHQALFEFRRVLANLVLEETLLAHAYGAQLLTYPAFFKRLEHALENANFRRPQVSREAITVCSADLVPNRRFKVIIMAGLNEGEFPRRSEQSGFLSKDEVRKWMSYGIDIENPRHHQSFEPSLYDSLVERATDILCQSSPIYEMNGDELIPSFFLTRGDESLARELPFRAPRRQALVEPTSAAELASSWLWLSGRQAMRDLDLNTWMTFDVREFLAKLEIPFSTVQARTEARNKLNELNGCLTEQVSLNLISVKTPEMWSVSRLNDYGKCPFRFWVSHTLKIEKMEEPELGLDSRLLGEVYHKALELFYLQLNSRSLSILSTEDVLLEELFKDSIASAIEWLEATKKFRQTDFWEYEKKEISFRLRRFFTKEKERAMRSGGEFVPTYFEKGFGFKDGDSSPALVLNVDGQQIKMHGRVDRIDVSSDGRVKVIDYKSSSGAISKKEALAGRNMQLPVYAMAVTDAILAANNPQVKSGSFLSFSSGEQIGTLDFQDGENDYVGITRSYIGEFVSSIKRGDFSVRPSSPDSCKHCDHRQVCRITELGASDDSGD